MKRKTAEKSMMHAIHGGLHAGHRTGKAEVVREIFNMKIAGTGTTQTAFYV